MVIRRDCRVTSYPRSSRGRSIRTLLKLLLFLSSFADYSLACSVHKCNGDFVANTKNIREGPYYVYCRHLDSYLQCVEGEAAQCHGNLLYHGTKISVDTLLTNNNCLEILKAPPNTDIPDAYTIRDDSFTDQKTECWYEGKTDPAYCGLFGDPHLKTFNGSFMTCKVLGAWPLISSTHLSVQVTNELVGENYKATAATKVTVLINDGGDCGKAKTYEASVEELPKAFVDGTTSSGTEPDTLYAEVIEASPGQHVIIRVRRVNGTVAIRKVGKYLTVSVTIPREVVAQLGEEGTMQLCEQGCPQSELLLTSKNRVPAISEREAVALCSEFNVTDYYLDSCVFDLLTTGDTTFGEAAYLSLKDMWKSDSPSSLSILKNCTRWPCMWKATSGSAVPKFTLLSVVMFVMLDFR